MSKNNYDQFNLPPTGPKLCDFYGQYIGFGGGGPTGVPIISVGNSALYTTTSQELERTVASAGNVDKFTFSAWVYFTKPTTSSSTPIFGAINGSANQHRLLKTNVGQLQHDLYLSNSFVGRITTTQLLRDQAWYHIVAVYDSGNSVADNRMMFYLNGQRITNLGTKTYPSQNLDGLICGAHLHQLGLHDGLSLSLDGYMAEAVLIDGSVLTPTSFGQYDSTGTFWTPLDSATIQLLTFGTTGFYLANKVTNQPQLDFKAGDDNTLANSRIKSLLHFDGSDAATTFTDSASLGPSWTAAGDAQLDTAQKKFGTASLLLDGTGDSISTPSLGLPGTDPFTIDMWVRRNGANTNNAIFSFGVNSGGTSNQQIRILTSTDNKLIISTNNAGVIGTGDHSTSLPDGEFAHVAVTRSGNTIYLFQNGTLLANASFSYDLTDPNPYYIGKDINAANNFNGHIDEFRVILGECKYTANFSVETSAYSNPPTGNNFTNTGSVTTNTHTPSNLHNLWNPLMVATNGSAASVGNTRTTVANTEAEIMFSTLPFDGTGKYYAEIHCVTGFNDGSGSGGMIAVVDPRTIDPSAGTRAYNQSAGNAFGYYYHDGKKYTNGASGAAYGATFTNGDKIGIYINGGTVYLAKNNALQNSASEAEVTNGTTTNAFTTGAGGYVLAVLGAGGNNPVADLKTVSTDWEYTPFSGFNEITTTSIAAATTRTKSDLSEYFESIVYEGNGLGQTVGRHLPFTNSYTIAKSGLFQLVATGQNAGNDSLQSTSALANGTSNQKFTFSFWFKLSHGHADMSTNSYVFNHSNDDSGLYSGILFSSANKLEFHTFAGSNTQRIVSIDTPIFDQSKWYHAVCAVDTTQSTALDRIIWYLDGVRQAVTVTNQIAQNNTGIGLVQDVTHSWGSFIASSSPRLPFDGYLAEIVYNNNIQDVPGSFGETDAATGAWVPKSLSGMSFEATGYYLNFATLGADVSGNSNTFTNSGVTQVNDSPTTNFGTLLNNKNAAEVLTNGNRTATGVSGQAYFSLPSGLRMTTEKIFVAMRMDDGADGSSQVNVSFGCQPPNANIDSGVGPTTDSYAGIDRQGGDFRLYNNSYDDTPGAFLRENHTISAADTDVITMAVDPSDPSNGKVWFGVYDTSEDSHQYIPNIVGGTAGDPAQGTLPTIDGINFKGPTNPLGEWRIFIGGYRDTAGGTILLDSADIPITIPSGFLEYKQSNIKKGRTVATGASADEITPSYITAWNWIKNRDAADSHMMFDRVRGVAKDLHPNAAEAEVTDPNTMYQFLRGGVRVMDDVQVNTEKESYVSWQWYMEATGTGSSNTDGDINTTSTLVDTNLGLSISKFDSGANGDHTIGHGLGVIPEFVIFKDLESANNWSVYSSHAGFSDVQDYILLNTTGAVGDNGASLWGAAFPTDTVLGFTTGQINNANVDCVAYCIAPSQLNSIGSYVGNGNANGTFIPTVNSLGIPITPSWFMAKSTGAGQDWRIVDDSRSPFNVNSLHLRANGTDTETSEDNLDIVTGGIKIRTSSGGWNTDGTKYIYLAFGTPIIDTSGRIITGR